MTTINLTNITPPTLSNLVATALPEAIKLRWDTPNDNTLWQTEVWVNSSNDRSTATLAFTTIDNTYLYNTAGGNTRYFWVRSINKFGYNNGTWEPTSSTGGVSATALIVAVGAGTTTASVSSGNSGSSPTITNFNTWYACNYYYFTAPAKGNVVGYAGVKCTSTLPTGGSTGNVMTAYVRFRLYDNTVSSDVIGGTFTYLIYRAANFGGTWTVAVTDQIPQHNWSFNSDLIAHLISGHDYRMYVEIMKERTIGTTGAYTLTFNSDWGQISSGATYG